MVYNQKCILTQLPWKCARFVWIYVSSKITYISLTWRLISATQQLALKAELSHNSVISTWKYEKVSVKHQVSYYVICYSFLSFMHTVVITGCGNLHTCYIHVLQRCVCSSTGQVIEFLGLWSWYNVVYHDLLSSWCNIISSCWWYNILMM